MIKAKSDARGTSVTLDGGLIQILEELIAILDSANETLSEAVDDEFAKKTIAYCGQLAFIDDDKEKKEAAKDFNAYLVELIKKEEVV